MGKKKVNTDYNDFLDGEKLKDNADIRTSLQNLDGSIPASSSGAKFGVLSSQQDISPPPTRHDRRGGGKKTGKPWGKGKSGLKKPQLTHFLCLPLVNSSSGPQIEARLANLKTKLEKDAVVPLKAVRPVGTLHLTLGVMSLDEAALQDAGNYLKELNVEKLLSGTGRKDPTVIAEKAAELGMVAEGGVPPSLTSEFAEFAKPYDSALSVDLKNLVPMQSPHKTSILYAEPVDRSKRLFPFAEKLRDGFTERGLLVKDTRPLKLHATVINTVYAKSGGRRGRGRKGHGKERSARSGLPVDGEDGGVHLHEDGVPDDGVETSTTDLNDGEQGDQVAGSKETVDGAPGHGPNASSWLRFDARDLISQYQDFKWAENVAIDRVQICKMGAKKILDDAGEIVDEKYEVVFEKNI